ncbi:PREDICTED: putative late blight resistance protein homolog R1A-4 [Ipomoea nil]|uniref:putative late blight resistance protein homolog R1A-4 n=1 Tax=Ipomoea nil TaxID=35883 RepID=UPI000900F541|nr:PREDICTED: putative late blight resistance protein homolog R1A-4 [Ipomoea nil]
MLKILTGGKESYVSDREMASAALTILIAKFKYYFLQIFPSVYARDKATMIYFLANLYSLQVCLMQMKSNGAAAIKIRNFALKAVNDIEIQLSNFCLERVRKASQILHQTLQEAAEIAAKLLKIIHKEQHERKRVMTCGIKSTLLEHSSMQVFLRLNTFMTKLYYDFLHSTPIVPLDDEAAMISFFQNLSSLQDYLLQKESSGGGGATINDLETKIRYFVSKVGDDVETQVKNLVQAKHDTEYQEQASQLNQTLQEAAETVAELLMSINSEKECKTEVEMACGALSSLMGTIEEFLYAEVETESFLKSPHDKAGIKSNLLGKLFSLQVFLQKESNGGGATMKYLETKIKDFTLKAKDDIKIQLYNFLQAKDTEYEEKVSQELHHTMQEAAESATELLKIISRCNEVDDANETQPSNTWLKHASRSTNVEFDGSSRGLLMPGGRMVGRHHDCTVIKDQLFSSEELKVISIVGMVGIGKTTVAKNVYEDPSVASHFDVRGWVTIPQDYDKSRMLSDLLQSITPAERNVINKRGTPDELEMQVRECLRRWRYLIVLDNVLSNQTWTDIIQCLPDYCRGSCILLTTSHLNRYNYQNKYIHNMTLLNPKESWELFCNILSIEEHLAPKFEKIRNRVVEKCDGLPQLIVEVAKRLSKCNNIQQGWKKIEKELESLGLLDRNALSVSYNMLPHHVKVCFLYFGVFPKRKRILVKMLIRLWIAEGFVEPLKHELEDQAYEYLQELIDRSLLLIEDRSCNGKIKTCRAHSALHSFCVGEAQRGVLQFPLSLLPNEFKKSNKIVETIF